VVLENINKLKAKFANTFVAIANNNVNNIELGFWSTIFGFCKALATKKNICQTTNLGWSWSSNARDVM